jgi:arsenite methyltransferase
MDKPIVLILCTGNSCRSQIAEGILRREVGDLVSVESAGSDPAKYVHPKAIQVKNELGIDISKNRSKHLSLGCGNPISIAALQAGEVVVDLGSGGGIDCFLAAKIVGPNGRVIGVDMTPEMLSKATANAKSGGYENVEFRLGEIEFLPVADHSADAVISNCVINLSPSKLQVYREAFRVLKPGGRLAVADMVALQPLPDGLKADVAAYTGCLAGAELVDQLKTWLTEAGFEAITIRVKQRSSEFIRDPNAGTQLDDFVASAEVVATKPGVSISKGNTQTS